MTNLDILFIEILKFLALEKFNLTGKDDLFMISNQYEIYRFFYNCKQNYNFSFLKDIYFNDDPDFPYSKQIDLMLLKLEDLGYLKRYYNHYKINTHLYPPAINFNDEINEFIDLIKKHLIITK